MNKILFLSLFLISAVISSCGLFFPAGYSSFAEKAMQGGSASGVPRDGLVGEWLFNDGTGNDTSGKGNHALLINSPRVINDRLGTGKALGLASSASGGSNINPTIVIPPATHLDLTTSSDWTVNIWVRNEFPYTGPVISFYSGQMMTYLAIDLIYFGMGVKAGITNSVSNMNVNFDYQQMPLGAWVCLTMVVRSGKADLYIDGTIKVSGLPVDLPADVGINVGNNNLNWYYTGEVDDLRIYNRSLSESEILLLVKENGSGGGGAVSSSFSSGSSSGPVPSWYVLGPTWSGGNNGNEIRMGLGQDNILQLFNYSSVFYNHYLDSGMNEWYGLLNGYAAPGTVTDLHFLPVNYGEMYYSFTDGTTTSLCVSNGATVQNLAGAYANDLAFVSSTATLFIGSNDSLWVYTGPPSFTAVYNDRYQLGSISNILQVDACEGPGGSLYVALRHTYGITVLKETGGFTFIAITNIADTTVIDLKMTGNATALNVGWRTSGSTDTVYLLESQDGNSWGALASYGGISGAYNAWDMVRDGTQLCLAYESGGMLYLLRGVYSGLSAYGDSLNAGQSVIRLELLMMDGWPTMGYSIPGNFPQVVQLR